MKRTRWCGTVLAGMLALAGTSPQGLGVAPAMAAGPATAAVDLAKFKDQLRTAQGQILNGSPGVCLEAMRALQEIGATAPAELAPQIAFAQKLGEVRLADCLRNEARVLPALGEALKQATQADQVAACWQLGLKLTQAALAAKSPAATGLMGFLATQAAPAMRQAGPHIELARLQLALGHAPAAEAELAKAASAIASPADSAAWTAVVAELAGVVDGGLAPKAGADLFERLHKAATPAVQAALDVVEGRALLGRSELAGCEVVFLRAIAAPRASKEQSLAALALGYDLSAALSRAGNATDAAAVLAKAEAFAQSRPASPERDQVLVSGLQNCGQAARAADLAWKSALAAKLPAQRQQMLLSYAQAAVAAGREGEVAAKLQSMNAPAGIYTAAASALLTKTGNAQAGLAIVEAIPAQTVVEDPQAVAAITAVMRQVHQAEKQTAAEQAARCRLMATWHATAAQQATTAKNAPKAAAHAKQAAAFQALGTELGK